LAYEGDVDKEKRCFAWRTADLSNPAYLRRQRAQSSESTWANCNHFRAQVL